MYISLYLGKQTNEKKRKKNCYDGQIPIVVPIRLLDELLPLLSITCILVLSQLRTVSKNVYFAGETNRSDNSPK